MKKKTICFPILFFLSLLRLLQAQTVTVTWPLNSTTTVNATVSNTALTAAAETRGPGFTSTSFYGNYTIAGGSAVSAQATTVNPGPASTSAATAHANGGYVQFAFTPQAGYSFTPDSIALYMGSGNANSNGTSIEYSINSDFSNAAVLGAPTGSTAFLATNQLYLFKYAFPGSTLYAGQTLYLRIYAWNGNGSANRYLLLNNLVISGTAYTARPQVTTAAVSNIASTTVTAGGAVVDDGGSAITERGVVYGTQVNPIISNNKAVADSGGAGNFTVSVTGLTEYTTYHVRAYAINSEGIAYGEDVLFFTPALPDVAVTAPKQMERISRGLVAVRTDSNAVYIGWRLFGTDSSGLGFNIYRNGVKINDTPIIRTTNYIDSTAINGGYMVKTVVNGVEQAASRTVQVWTKNYLDIALQQPAGGTTPAGEAYTYTANDCSVGDLDGDGEYEIIVKWDPTNSKDNSQSGYTGNVYLDAYKLDGTKLWRIDLGCNIRAGAHYTQFMVYDLDGDGKAEVACKTADATIDGAGVVIGDAQADYRNSSGYVLDGPEFLTVFNGVTGAAMATASYVPARGSVAAWGDSYGNRVDRFLAAVAYVDGQHPSLIMARGYYTRLVRAAWDWRNGQLTLRWVFDSDSTGNSAYRGDGNHQMTVGDVDGDGKQEFINGSSAINDNGRGLWTNEMGHGDALHMSDMDPDRPGLEIWQPYETPASNGLVGAALVDAKTGERIFTVSEASADVGRGLAADIDPRYKGYELWAARGNLYTVKGVQIGTTKPSMNFAIWWDGDLSRELLDGTVIQKWQYLTSTRTNLLAPDSIASNNSTKATPNLTADLFGDWREEVIWRTADNNHLRIYTTTIPTEHRIYTLMHDPQYRMAVAWQNSGYNQPPHPGFYLGTDMDAPPSPNITYVKDTIAPIALAKNVTVVLHQGQAAITAAAVDAGSYDAFDIDSLEISKSSFDCSDIGQQEITLIVTDKSGNKATATAVVTVVGSVPSQPVIAGADSITLYLGYQPTQATLAVANAGVDTVVNAYQWLPVEEVSHADSAVAVFTPTAEGQYIFAVTATNAYGCASVSAPVMVTVTDVRCGNRKDKVVVCHHGHELCIASTAVSSHLAHGDSLGNCSCSTDSIGHGNGYTNRLTVYPNPVKTNATVRVQLARAGRFVVALYDIRGALIKVVANGNNSQPNQIYQYDLPVLHLRAGLYFIKLTTVSQIITQPVIVL